MYQAQSIHVQRSGRRVLANVSFSARPGELTAILGPNGSGKTTLLKALSGELAYDGRITLNGADIRSMRPQALAQRRAVLDQSLSMVFPFSVGDVLQMGLQAGSAHDPQMRDHIVRTSLAAVNLAGQESRIVGQMSGGEQQRVHMARVLAQIPQAVQEGSPCWLLLDEPVSSLDYPHQLMVMDLARRFCDSGGGVIAILHDLNVTAAYADRVCLMKQGASIAEGPVDAILTPDWLEQAYDHRFGVHAVPGLARNAFLPQRRA